MEKYYKYLDDLQKTGETDMWGARPLLTKAFPELNKPDARLILLLWLELKRGQNE